MVDIKVRYVKKLKDEMERLQNEGKQNMICGCEKRKEGVKEDKNGLSMKMEV